MGRKVGIWGVAAVVSLVFASSASAFDAKGSVEQVYVTGLTPGASVSLRTAGGQLVETRTANVHGGSLFRTVTPGSGYRVSSGAETSGPLTVLTTQSAPPDPSIYNQTLEDDGYGYLTTRDGTKLAYSVHPPSDALGALPIPAPLPPLPVGPPFPTLIEYSGYGYANPDGPDSGIAALANIMGYTVVDVNMRGTGCSGGAFDFFEPLQTLDGYDIIETVSRQSWVGPTPGAPDDVGMLGISYGGISQLFTAQTQPPSLAAITPLSVIDGVQTTLYPGGILNTGFSLNWARERMREAQSNIPHTDSSKGQAWARQRVAEGDQTCIANQTLHPELADLEQKIRDNDHYIPEVADPVSPNTFVDKINVPTFMACQWTDEQTGGHCPTLAKKMLDGPNSEDKWFTFTNGTHVDSLSPENLNRLYNFLEIYVAKEPPAAKRPLLEAAAPVIFQAVFGIDGPGGAPPDMTLPPPDAPQQAATHADAKAAWEAQPPIRILFDNGAGDPSNPGWPYPGFERSFSDWPIPGATARSWYLGPSGALVDDQPGGIQADQFTWDADARPLTNFTGNTGSGDDGLWTETPPYNWTQDPAGTAVAYETAPLAANARVIGAGRVDLWVRSSEPNADLQATISEVRPDGKETFVQGGWIRPIARSLDEAKSTELEPVPSFLEEDFADLPSDRFEKVTIPLYYEGHAYRAGSKIRVRISAPNGDQPIWSFSETDPALGETAEVEIGYGEDRPSRLVLPVVAGTVPTGLPPCPALRGQPCRDYVPIVNAASPDPSEPPPGDSGSGSPGTQGGPGNQGASPGAATTGKRCKKPKRKPGAAKKKKRCVKTQLLG